MHEKEIRMRCLELAVSLAEKAMGSGGRPSPNSHQIIGMAGQFFTHVTEGWAPRGDQDAA